MSRPRSEERRNAILAAATEVIAAQGLGAPTATIAKAAGVSNGSLFLYFDTKAVLINELYLSLKTEMGAAAVDGLPIDAANREQVLHMWTHWLQWATTFPEKRRALAQLEVADEITPESHATVSLALNGIADLLERSRTEGPLRDASLGFALTLTTAVADAAIDSILRDPAAADIQGRAAFDAIWRMLA